MKTGFRFCLLFAAILILAPGRVAEPAGSAPEDEVVVLTQAPLDPDLAIRTPAGMPMPIYCYLNSVRRQYVSH